MNNVAQYDVESIRNDLPILGRQIHGKPLVYLDNGASAQRPKQVIDAEHIHSDKTENKQTGAFCAGNFPHLPYILLNATGKISDVFTLQFIKVRSGRTYGSAH